MFETHTIDQQDERVRQLLQSWPHKLHRLHLFFTLHAHSPRSLSTQASVNAARAEADCALQEFENLRRKERHDIESTMGKELGKLQEALAEAKVKTAADISRSQVILKWCS